MIVRQGDVLLRKCDAKASDLEEHESRAVPENGLHLADGESSGHYHAIFGKNARLMHYKASTERVVAWLKEDGEIRVVGGGSGGVDRHTPIALKKGKWEVLIQQTETSANVSRRVED